MRPEALHNFAISPPSPLHFTLAVRARRFALRAVRANLRQYFQAIRLRFVRITAVRDVSASRLPAGMHIARRSQRSMDDAPASEVDLPVRSWCWSRCAWVTLEGNSCVLMYDVEIC